MPKLRRLSGQEVVGILRQFGFVLVSQRGSHMKLKRVMNGDSQVLTIPAHAEIDTGTLRAIFRQACRYLSESDLKPHFYSE
jgi:predicted RNA binding protein YcfA (HicA-like mRNA interferase family)